MKNQSLLFVIGLLIASFGMIFWLDGEVINKQQQVLGEKIEISQKSKVESQKYDDEQIKQDGNIGQDFEIAMADKQLYTIVKIVDGDIIDVNIDGEIKRIRLIGIDIPESVDPRRQVECFSEEATEKLTELLGGNKIYIDSDKTQSDKDIYGRLLRYIWNEEGLFINEEMIKQGYAHEYTYKIPYVYQNDFKLVERYAQELKLGLWADEICNL